MKEGDISKGPLRAQSTHIPLYKTFHTSLDGSDHDRVHVQSILQSGWALIEFCAALAFDGFSRRRGVKSNLITYQEEP